MPTLRRRGQPAHTTGATPRTVVTPRKGTSTRRQGTPSGANETGAVATPRRRSERQQLFEGDPITDAHAFVIDEGTQKYRLVRYEYFGRETYARLAPFQQAPASVTQFVIVSLFRVFYA